MGYTNIGPNYWQGEAGRLAVIDGSAKLTDEAYVAPFRTIALWADYLPSGFEAQSYPDSQNLFTLGRAALYPMRGMSLFSKIKLPLIWPMIGIISILTFIGNLNAFDLIYAVHGALALPVLGERMWGK